MQACLTSLIHDDMRIFAEKFTNSRAEFDFVNVGRGKENADSKMRSLPDNENRVLLISNGHCADGQTEMFNYFYKKIQCRKIFFAGCHDTGYLYESLERRGEPDAEERIVLLETMPAEPPFKSLNFALTRFNNVFRSECLGKERKRMIPVLSPQSYTPLVSTAHPILSRSEITLREVSDPSAAPDAAALPVRHLPPTAKVAISGNGGISVQYPSSYAVAGGLNSHHNMINISIPVTKTGTAKVIECNNNNHRLDPPNKHPVHHSSCKVSFSSLIEFQVRRRILCFRMFQIPSIGLRSVS
jgi:hypothetical protein